MAMELTLFQYIIISIHKKKHIPSYGKISCHGKFVSLLEGSG